LKRERKPLLAARWDVLPSKDQLDRFTKRLDGPIGRLLERLGVLAIDKNSSATGAVTAIDISPAIANQKTLRQIDVERIRCAQDHSRLWLVTVTRISPISAGVPADLDPRNLWKGIQDFPVHRLNGCARLRPARHIRLVGHHDKQITGRFEVGAASRHVFVKIEIFYLSRRVGPAFADYRLVDDTVAVEKDRAPP
jgi:hypothetical protein